MKTKIIFIHGMFQNGKSWERWMNLFREAGYECSAPSWPSHQDEPVLLREHAPEELGRLTLDAVIELYAHECRKSEYRPILIGHSVGGLIAQVLASQGLASAAVCLSSIAPNDLIAADWHLLKNVTAITNPFEAHSIFENTPEFFHENFCNTMSAADSDVAYAETATHDSRQVLRDCLGRSGRVDLKAVHVPLLFIGADDDHIVPTALVRRNCGHYSDLTSVTEFTSFPGRGHFLCNEPGWQEIAHYVERWLAQQVESIYSLGGVVRSER